MPISQSEHGVQLAAGRTADVFDHGPGRVLKLFRDWFPSEFVEREATAARAASELRLPTPKVIDVVESAGRRGIVFERIDGPLMLDEMLRRPWRAKRLARELAELHVKVHLQSPAGLPSRRDELIATIRSASEMPEHVRDPALEMLNRLEPARMLCHGDFHPGNVILSSHGPVVIDWLAASHGDPAADVARTLLVMEMNAPPEDRSLRGRVRAFVHNTLQSNYLSACVELGGYSSNNVMAWLLPTAVAHLTECVHSERTRLLELIAGEINGLS